MWNESLELHPARRLEENNSVTLESGLELRPEIFDIRSVSHAPAHFVSRSPARTLRLRRRCPTRPFPTRCPHDIAPMPRQLPTLPGRLPAAVLYLSPAAALSRASRPWMAL